MSNYRSLYQENGCYFFTLVTHKRQAMFQGDATISLLRQAFRRTMQKRPFNLTAIVILPDHLHCIWQLPQGDADFSTRWKILKTLFTKAYKLSNSCHQPIWQPRFWEHLIRDDRDMKNHLDYIHYNPVRHGLVKKPMDWQQSSFPHFVKAGLYPPDWGEEVTKQIIDMDLE